MSERLVILGAGPCGLGAAWRLKELGCDDFHVFEMAPTAGGLASSFLDEKGFTWDIGGHVQFSHYEDFDRVMDATLPDGWFHHDRSAWVWMEDRFIPYPLQKNLWRLREESIQDCLRGLEARPSIHPQNFSDWMLASFGEGLCRHFMRPYNFKVWAHPSELMSYSWIGERVATVDLAETRRLVESRQDALSWGPNAKFRFPTAGGTGAIWRTMSQVIGSKKFSFNRKVVGIDTSKKELELRNELTGEREVHGYDRLLSTLPLDSLSQILGIRSSSGDLLASETHIVGIGLRGELPETLKGKSWIYFPEGDCPFYRVTVFSNYSPAHTPDPKRFWSLMAEVSSSTFKAEDTKTLKERVLRGLMSTKLIQTRDQVESLWSFHTKRGYPIPSLNRDSIVKDLLEQLEEKKISSRGRFGAWKYEVSNQDHTFMQGFEWADRVLMGREEVTVYSPQIVNAPGKREIRPRS